MALPERVIRSTDRLSGKDSTPGIFEYWESRFGSERFWLALQRGEQIKASERPAYAQQLGEELSYLERSLEFDANNLADLRKYEFLLGLCDWKILRPWDDKFVTEMTRVLVGNSSGLNKRLFDEGVKGAEDYVGFYSDSEIERLKKVEKSVEDDINPAFTYNLGLKFGRWGQDSLLFKSRQRLGVTPDNEKKYYVAVLNSESRTKWDDKRQAFVSPFQRKVDCDNPCAGITLHGVFKHSTVVLPRDVYLKIMSDDTDESEKGEKTAIHEYAHTQLKDLKLGARRRFGSIFSEAMTVTVSEGDSYPEVIFLMNYMDRVLRQQEGKSFLDEFERTFADVEARQEFAQFVADNFGYRSLISLYTVAPTSYKSSKGISRVPEVRDDDIFTSLWQIIRDERERIAPGVDTAFTSNFLPYEGKRLHALAMRGNIKLPSQIDRKLEASYL